MSAKTQRRAKSKVKRHTSKRRRASDKFCVIAVSAINRRWFDTEAEAVHHAEPMILNCNRPMRVMVVKACKLIAFEPPQPPPPVLTVRAPQDYDFARSRAEADAEYMERARQRADVTAGIARPVEEARRPRWRFGR